MADTTYDLVIVGSGVGGLTAAITAKLAGLEPLLIEKTDLLGGSSALSGGVMWLPHSPPMIREGVADSREAGLTYLANFVEGDPAWSTVKRREAFVDAAGPLVEMYEAQGMRFEHCPGYSDYYDDRPGGIAAGRSIEVPPYNAKRLGRWKARLRPPAIPLPVRTSEGPSMLTFAATPGGKKTLARVVGRFLLSKLKGQTLYTGGAALQGNLLEVAVRLGVDIRTGIAFAGFDMADGRVVGIHVTSEGRQETIAARRGVLIAAGGFSHNKAMREQYQRGPITDAWTSSNPGDTGEALAAMAALGADLAQMQESWWTMTFAPPGKPIDMIVADLAKPRGILVDTAGQRFVNEAGSYMEIGQACFERGVVPAWFIRDADARKRYFFGTRPPGGFPKDLVASGAIKVADTIEDLARQCGIDPAGLSATVARFNGFAAAGKDDDFGRGGNVYDRYFADPTNTPNPTLGPIAKPPYWAAPLVPGDVGTCGGVVSNDRAQVMRADGTAIEGLYAAGNCTAPIAGPYYIGAGLSIAASAVFGFVAAKDVAG
jgi:3-oxosteroid 1-dehydrogenase